MQSLRMSRTQASPDPQIFLNGEQTPKMSVYEQSREERIRANLERMQKLGLMDLTMKLKPERTPKRKASSPKELSPFPPSGSLRRSSRLQNSTPISYSEAVIAKKNGLLEDENVLLEEGSRPEIYTEEHEKLLGTTERSWTLFVDGIGADGKRIYDQVKGKTCHQCRQKTLGYRTHCSKCEVVQGQFCGDCLYMRYGEHVLEAIENPNWICPPCRGICNCSLCRQAKGWPPTGALYRKISRLGYKSVAHYLIQTRRPQNSVGKDSADQNQVSAKRSLPFSDTEAPSKEPQINSDQVETLNLKSKNKLNDMFNVNTEISHMEASSVELQQINDNQAESLKPESEDKVNDALNITTEILDKEAQPLKELQEINDNQVRTLEPEFDDKVDDSLKVERRTEMLRSGNSTADDQKRSSFSGMEPVEINNEMQDQLCLSTPNIENETEKEFKVEEETILHSVDKEHDANNYAMDGCFELERKCELLIEESQYIITGRSKQGHQKVSGHDDNAELFGVNAMGSTVKHNEEVKKERELHGEDDKHTCNTIALASGTKLKEKNPRTAESNPDSIGARLRQKRRMSKGQDDDKLAETNEQNFDIRQAFESISSGKEVEVDKKLISTIKPSENSIARRLRPRH